jgi:hypothetical protein
MPSSPSSPVKENSLYRSHGRNQRGYQCQNMEIRFLSQKQVENGKKAEKYSSNAQSLEHETPRNALRKRGDLNDWE